MNEPRDEDAVGDATPCSTFGGFQIQIDRRCLIDSTGKSTPLLAQSLSVLQTLANQPNKVIAKDQLIRTVWPNVHVTDDLFIKCISDIRKAIGDEKHEILRTVPRQGYMLVSDSAAEDLLELGIVERKQNTLRLALTGAVLLIVGFLFFVDSQRSTKVQFIASSSTIAGTPTLKITDQSGVIRKFALSSDVVSQLYVSLSRYRTVQITDSPDAVYELAIATSTRVIELPRL